MNLIWTVTPEDWAEIKWRVAERGTKLNRSTMMDGQRDNRHAFTGVAGEMAGQYLLQNLKYHEGNPDFDFSSCAGLLLDVKTRSGNTPPRRDFDIRVPEYSVKSQDCDAYIFAHAMWEGPAIVAVFIVGWMKKAEFVKIARLEDNKTAEAQASGFNQKDGGKNQYFASINQLRPAAELLNL